MQFEGYSKDDYDMYGSIIWKFLTMQLLLIVLLQSEKQSQDLGYQDGFDQLASNQLPETMSMCRVVLGS